MSAVPQPKSVIQSSTPPTGNLFSYCKFCLDVAAVDGRFTVVIRHLDRERHGRIAFDARRHELTANHSIQRPLVSHVINNIRWLKQDLVRFVSRVWLFCDRP